MKKLNLENDTKIETGFKIPENYFEDFENRLFQRISFEESQKKIETGFKIPEDYFDTFEDRLLQRISFEETQDKITTGFKTPQDYFNNFEDRLLQRISFEESQEKINTGFKTPDDYFDNFETSIMEKISLLETKSEIIDSKNIKVISLWKRKTTWIYAVAATLVISLGGILYTNNISNEINFVSQEYLAYSNDVTTEDIINHLTEEDIKSLESELEIVDKDDAQTYINEYLN